MQPDTLLLLLLKQLLLRGRRELGALHRLVTLRQLVALAADPERALKGRRGKRVTSELGSGTYSGEWTSRECPQTGKGKRKDGKQVPDDS